MKRFLCVAVCIILMLNSSVLITSAQTTKNTVNVTLTTLDGKQVTTVASGKPKMLIFFQTGCYNCLWTFEKLSSPELDLSPVDIIAADLLDSSAEEIRAYVAENGFPDITYCTGSACSNAGFAYARSYLGASGFTTPLVVVLNAANEIVYLEMGYNKNIVTDVEAALGVSLKKPVCPDGHTPGKIVRVIYSYPTAEEHGFYERIQYCAECGNVISDRGLPFYQYGDVDANGRVDSDDLTMLAQVISKIKEPTVDIEIMADTNHDTLVNSDDLTLLAQYVSRIISEF